MGKHFAAISTCLAIVLNLLPLWAAASAASGGRDSDGGALQWEWAPPPSMVKEELGEFRIKRDAKG